ASNTGSFGSRQSSGIHVTPSPSDSGVADFETIIKDKDMELANLRATMEHNEEIIVRVYQEKEERWQEKLRELSARLDRSNQNEQQLFGQINRLQDERSQLQFTVQNLTAEKQGLQRKCLQIEREMFSIRDKLEVIAKQNSQCKKCGDSMPFFGNEHNGNNLLRCTVLPGKEAGPIPAPRLSKENSKSPSPAVELRSEVDALRGEVLSLKDTLTNQIGLFNDERKRWDEEKNKVLQHQKLLQSNFSHVTDRNKKLEDTFASLSNNGPINADVGAPVDRLV
uniref:Uncharacterized protein n=1 Tax=Plectus sambesii TaxID=2011161 RepID=A0A914XHC5_9BILA